ncbi:hypothetical protein FACS1894207_4730 [Bacteroidia bacterium]|nr:hypothetical protein FACS1894207_4730 [Bacteroidia bacterium]
MTTIDFTQLRLEQLITHHVGNKLRDEKYLLSSEVSILEDKTREFLLKYFILPVKSEEIYSFYHSVELEMNEMYLLARRLFENPESHFIPCSQDIAKLLYEQSMHPKIKEGELNITYFTNIPFDGNATDAIGIFKSENSVPFLKMNGDKKKYFINHDYGFEIKGIDKGCIILNVNSEAGYKILIVDSGTKAAEAQYWKDDFLKVQPISNEYHQTKEFLTIAKDFVAKQLVEEFGTSKADQIDYLNRSVEFCKKHEILNKNEFEQEIFKDDDLIDSFRKFDKLYRKENEIELSDNFEISLQAIKKQARVLKSVIKLDKNFDIYVHGNRDLIEQGIDERGRKFYKIYYQEES